MSHRQNSFTLIEVLLALFITAILTTILAVVFNTGLRAYRQGKDLIEITRKAQLIIGQMTRELSGAMVQSVGTTTYIPFVGNQNSVYFMAPVDNDSDVDLCEIGYNLVSPILKRHFLTVKSSDYEYPEDKVDYGENEVTFCENVTAFDLRYHDGSRWDTAWASTDANKLPTMVEVSVTIQGEYPKNAPRKQSKTFTTWIYLPNSTNNP